jgi:hypothetical protein
VARIDDRLRPDRDPDVVLPSVGSYFEVKVWVKERLFCVNGRLHDRIRSSSTGLDDEIHDPLIYLNHVVRAYESGEDRLKPRAEAAATYLLEREMFNGL